MLSPDETRQRYLEAVDRFVDKLRDDQNVIAVILCGSLSYDTVWEKSDVDITLVVRDQQLNNKSYCIVEDGIILNVALIQRSHFRRRMERTVEGSAMHSYYAKGRIIYTTDASLHEYFEEIKQLGEADLERCIFFKATEIIGCLNKSEKWLIVKEDHKYCQYYLLHAARAIADMELYFHGEIPTRESILRAKETSPDIMQYFYDDAMSFLWSQDRLAEAIARLDAYLVERLDLISRPLLEFLADGEIRTISEIVKQFNSDSHYIESICEYLSDKGVIEKVSKTIRITPKSRMAVEEAAYLHPGSMAELAE